MFIFLKLGCGCVLTNDHRFLVWLEEQKKTIRGPRVVFDLYSVILLDFFGGLVGWCVSRA